MKKVLALMLAVLMLSTVAFAATAKAAAVPGKSVAIARTGADVGKSAAGNGNGLYITAQIENTDEKVVLVEDGVAQNGADTDLSNFFPRAVNSTNYAITNVKYNLGKAFVDGVVFDDSEDKVKIKMKQDLTNTAVKEFEVEFKLKGKSNITVRPQDTAAFDSAYGDNYDTGKKYTLPDVKLVVSGTVGYGKVKLNVFGDNFDEIDGIKATLERENMSYDREVDIVTFGNKYERVAGAVAADAMLYEDFQEDTGADLALEARVYSGDTLYLDLDTDPDRDMLELVEDVTADIDFYTFCSNEKFVHFNSNAKVIFNGATEDDYVYEVKNNKVFPAGEFDEDYGCWVVTTRTLGKYIVSTEKLTLLEGTAAENPANGNPDTGANDVVGIATALAAVALVSAAAISLKK